MSEATQPGGAPPEQTQPAAAPEPAKAPPKKKPAAKKPKANSDSDRLSREYIVYREIQAQSGGLKLGDVEVPPGVVVLVPLGSTEAKTPKEARRTVAKAKLSEAELRSENGVPLRAITRSAADVGRGVARVKVEPTWDD